MRISIALEDSKDCLKFLQPLRPILRTWQQLVRNNKDFKVQLCSCCGYFVVFPIYGNYQNTIQTLGQ